MPTECSAERFDFGIVEGRTVEAAFDAGLVTSDAGALLLGATDRAIDLVDRFARRVRDRSSAELIEPAAACSAGGISWPPSCGPPTSTERPARSRRLPASLRRSARRGRMCASFCAPTAVLHASR